MLDGTVCYGMHLNLDRLCTGRVDASGHRLQVSLSCIRHGLGLRCGIILQRDQKLHNEQNVLLAGKRGFDSLVYDGSVIGFRCSVLDLQERWFWLWCRRGRRNVWLGRLAGLWVERALINQLAASQQGSHQQDASRQKKGTWSHDASEGTKIADNCSHIVRDRRRNGGFRQD